jgi:hypothetical protein
LFFFKSFFLSSETSASTEKYQKYTTLSPEEYEGLLQPPLYTIYATGKPLPMEFIEWETKKREKAESNLKKL